MLFKKTVKAQALLFVFFSCCLTLDYRPLHADVVAKAIQIKPLAGLGPSLVLLERMRPRANPLCGVTKASTHTAPISPLLSSFIHTACPESGWRAIKTAVIWLWP